MDIKGYRIEKVIGRGGMATVYLAVQTALERHVALKVMNPAFANDREFTTRFLQEGPIAAKLSDPQIVTVYDSGVDQKHYYLAMEYLPGGTLKQKIREGLSVEKSLNIIKLVAKGLAYAHSQRVLHRDIKPQNILFRASGEPVLTDFGIAKALTEVSHLTVPGTAFGSPKYMSPEQAKGSALDHRSDLYSLGVVFYEMLTGRPPFESKDAITLAQMHITNPVPPLPDRLAVFQPLMDRALSKDPNARYQSAEEFLSILKDARHRYELDISSGAHSVDVTQVRRPDHSGKIGSPAKRRSALPKLLTGFAVLAVAVIGGAYIYQIYDKDESATPTTNTNTAAVSTSSDNTNTTADNLSVNTANSPSPAETALTQAREQQQQGEFEQSLETVRRALQQAPEHAELLLLQNELQQTLTVQQQTASQAAAAADAEIKLVDTLSKARQLRRQGELEQSLDLVQGALQQNPEQPELLTLQQELETTIEDLNNRREAAAYLASAQKALQQDDLISSHEAIERGLALIPDHLELLALQNQVEHQIEQQQAALAAEQEAMQLYQQAQQQRQQNQLDTALNLLQEAQNLKPDEPQFIALRNEITAIQKKAELERQLKAQVAQWLEQARDQFNRLQLTTPEGNNAYETYQQILAQDPDNQDAKEGIEKIAAKYYELADQAQVSGETDKVVDYLDRGLAVQPDNSDLLALQKRIQNAQTARNQLTLARDLLTARQLEDSLSAVDAGLAAAQDDAELLALRAEIIEALDQREKQLIADTAATEAQQLAQQNDWAQALAVLDRALAEAPQNANLTALQEQLRQQQTQHEQQIAAEQHLSAALQWLDEDQLSSAYAEIQQGLQQVPDHAELLALKSRVEKQQALTTALERAQAFASEGQLENSLALVQRGLDLDSENASLLSLRDELTQAIEAQQLAQQTAAAQQTELTDDNSLAARDAATSDTSPDAASAAPNEEADLVAFGQGLASLAQKMGLQNAENFLRERVETLAQDQAVTDSSVISDDSTPNEANDAAIGNDVSTDQAASDDATAAEPQEDSAEQNTALVEIATTTEPDDPLLEQAENLLDPTIDSAQGAADDNAADSAATEAPQQTDSVTEEPPIDSPESQIAELLQTAETRLAKLNLTTPRGQSAYDAYRQILNLDPDNREAQQGLQTIVDRYQRWAVSQRDKGNFERSLGNIDKALRVDPDNRELQSLRQTIVTQQEAAEEAARRRAASAQQAPAPQATDPCAVDRGSKECWCKTLKMFCN